MKYYEIIKNLREDNDLKQKDVAIILNTTQSYYSKYERGVHPIPIEHIQKLCILYNVSADYILELPRNLPYPER
jgi:transcriptional regulator with XRE-family HTH domain